MLIVIIINNNGNNSHGYRFKTDVKNKVKFFLHLLCRVS